MDGAIVISERVHAQLTRMVRYRLLPREILEAIQEDDGQGLCNFVSEAVKAKRERAG